MEKLAERLQSCLKRKKNTPPYPDPLLLEIDLVVESVYGIPVYGKCPKGWVE